MKALKDILPRASKSFLEANPQLCGVDGQKVGQKPVQANVSAPQARRGKMNNTELEMAFILEHQKRNDEISDWRFEGITLRWEGVKYTPDFAVFPSSFSVSGKIKLLEVKGPFIAGNRARAVERFRHARTHWTQFDFELWQRSKDGQWSQIR